MKKPDKNTIPIKTYKSILENYYILQNKQYTEKHIKELLIDLRFIANQTKNIFKKSPFEKDMSEFIDFCNFIAHPIKDRGYMAKRINQNITLLQQSLIKPERLITIENGDLYFDQLKSYSVINYVTYMFSLIYLVLIEDIEQEELQKVHTSEVNDVSLCMLSLLQTSILELDNKDVDKSVLILNSNKTSLFLYSIVFSEKINTQLVQSGFNSQADSSLFLMPVVSSNINHIEVKQTKRNELLFFETYRNDKGHLSIKLI